MENIHNVLVAEKRFMEEIILEKLFHNLTLKNVILLVAKQDTAVK